MEHQRRSPSDPQDENFPLLRNGGNSALLGAFDADPGGLGVRAGESDPGRMLAAVLLLLVVAVIMLGLAWWLL
ncbi:MAG: hypothetical protein ACRDSR_03395 [Pseudonocardiaceae bacterium]